MSRSPRRNVPPPRIAAPPPVQCGQVEPRWIRLKDIKWRGVAEPQPNHMIAYERCTETRTCKAGDGRLCVKHWPGPVLTYIDDVWVG